MDKIAYGGDTEPSPSDTLTRKFCQCHARYRTAMIAANQWMAGLVIKTNTARTRRSVNSQGESRL